ncbi:MAG TPA: hypothetical protein VJR47_17225 [Stellaceae bacterium]|nr:hypothetical protein [Stellaceae bacterium]
MNGLAPRRAHISFRARIVESERLDFAGEDPDVVIGTSWDAGLIVIESLRQLGPDATAQQIRSLIANLKDLAGVSGIYNFPNAPERGLGVQDTIVVRWDAAHDRFV